MSGAAALHEEQIRSWLDRLGYRLRGQVRLELLRDGRSGAFTYRIRTTNRELDEAYILKLVLPGSPPEVLARGAREVLFYSLLADAVPLAAPEVVASYGPSDGAVPREPAHGAQNPTGFGDRGVALLIKEYRSPQPIKRWNRAQFETVARDLARLHACYWDKVQKLERSEWLRRPNIERAAFRERATRAWRALWAQERLATVFQPPVIDRITQALEVLSSPSAPLTLPELPLTLCHGDAHHENLLVRDDGGFVWADWQEVGIGHGVDDLSFFYQRAAAVGAQVDLPDMLRTYHEELQQQTGEPVDPAALQERAAFYELTTRLFQWPAHLEHAPEGAVEAHVARVMVLLNLLIPSGSAP